MKWNFYESDFDTPEPTPAPSGGSFWSRFKNPPTMPEWDKSSIFGLDPVNPNPNVDPNKSWWQRATDSFLPEYEPSVMNNEESTAARLTKGLAAGGGPLTQLAYSALGGMSSPWVNKAYEKVVRPFASPAGVALSAVGPTNAAISTLAEMTPATVAASRAAPVLERLVPAAQKATAFLKSPAGIATKNVGKSGLTLGGVGMSASGLGGAWEAGKEFVKDPSEERAAETLWSLGEAAAGAFGANAAYNSIGGRPIEVPARKPPIGLKPSSLVAEQEQLAIIKDKIAAGVPLTKREAGFVARSVPPSVFKNQPGVPTTPPASAFGQSAASLEPQTQQLSLFESQRATPSTQVIPPSGAAPPFQESGTQLSLFGNTRKPRAPLPQVAQGRPASEMPGFTGRAEPATRYSTGPAPNQQFEVLSGGETRTSTSSPGQGKTNTSKTVFLDPDTAAQVTGQLTRFGPGAQIQLLEDGSVAIIARDPVTGRVRNSLSRIKGSDTPAPGLIPLEITKPDLTRGTPRKWEFRDPIQSVTEPSPVIGANRPKISEAVPTFETEKGVQFEQRGRGTQVAGETAAPSDRTIYLDPATLEKTQIKIQSLDQGPTTARIQTLKDGGVAIVVRDRVTGQIRSDLSSRVRGQSQPAEGLTPLEVWKRDPKTGFKWNFRAPVAEVGRIPAVELSPTTGLSPAEIATRKRWGVSEVGEAVSKRKPRQTVDQTIQTLYGKREGAPIRGEQIRRSLEAVDKIPTTSLTRPGAVLPDADIVGLRDKLAKVQSGDPRYQAVRDYFDSAYRRAKEAGMVGRNQYRTNYLPQLWEQDAGTVAKVLGKRMSKKAAFSYERVFEDYEAGIQAGLTPRYKNISELAGWYETELNKKMATNEAFRALRQSGNIKAAVKGRPPEGFIELDAKIFPAARRVKVKGDILNKPYYASPEAYEVLKAMYVGADPKLKTFADFMAFPKNIFFAGGIPTTSINRHFWNLGNRAFKEGGGPSVDQFRRIGKGSIDLERTLPLVEAGMTTSIEDKHLLSLQNEQMIDKIRKVPWVGGKLAGTVENFERWFERPLFQEKVPPFKQERGQAQFEIGKKAGLTDEEAYRRSADIMNIMYGGVSRTPQGWHFKNPTALEGARAGALASDWLQTKVQLGKKELLALAGKEDPAYVDSFKRGLATTALRWAPRIAAGAAIKERLYPGTVPAGEAIKVPWMDDDKADKYRQLDPIGTSDELQKIPEILLKASQTGVWSTVPGWVWNQVNLPPKSIINLLTGGALSRKFGGEPLWTVKDYRGKEIPVPKAVLLVLGEIGQNFSPAASTALAKLATGNGTVEEAIAAGVEAPVVYRFIQKIKERQDKMPGFGSSGSKDKMPR